MRSLGPGVRWAVRAVTALSALAFGTSACGGGEKPRGAAPTVLYVDSRAPPGGDGRSWDTALRFVADALHELSEGGTIRVAAGTYRPDRRDSNPDGSGDRDATFQLRDGVRLAGGFAGIGAADPQANDPSTYETILSGDLLGDDGPQGANNDENARHVVTGSGTGSSAELDGFTISGGNADGAMDYPGPGGVGGGLLDWQDGSPTITRCTFRSNTAYWAGGAIANGFGSSPTISDCRFDDNLTLQRAYLPQGPDQLDSGGGAIVDVADSAPKITACTFSNNSAFEGGAVLNEIGAAPRVVGCSFQNNSASPGNGGAMYSDKQALPYVRDCVFRGNSAAHAGGALGFRQTAAADAQIIDSVFEDNHAGGSGGGIRAGQSSSVHVINSTFDGNYTTGGSTTIFPGPAGGLDVGSDAEVAIRTSTVDNSIFWNNSSGGKPRQLAASGKYPAGLVVAHSDVEGGAANVFVSEGFPFTWGAGNLDADPAFVDVRAHDLHLGATSPCRKAGDPAAFPSDVETDLDGNARFAADGSIDLGPYERTR